MDISLLADGFIRCFDGSNGTLLWELLDLIKVLVTSVYVNLNQIISGGEDGVVKVWGGANQNLMFLLNIDYKSVIAAFPDIKEPKIIHSCGFDKTIFSWNTEN